MSAAQPHARMTVGVIVERRKAESPWADFIWQPVAIMAGEPTVQPWTQLGGSEERAAFYAGAAEIELFRTENANYRENLQDHSAVWVSLRLTGTEPPYELVGATVDPAEGESYTEAGENLVERLSMPEAMRDFLAVFVAENAVYEDDYKFVKRKRDRADPEALARRGPMHENDE